MSNKDHYKFTINNFRIFDKPYTFELAPITILTGPNNSGKSSLVKALNLINTNKINGRLRNFIDFNSKDCRLFGAENIFNNIKKKIEYSFVSIENEICESPIKYDLSFDNSGLLDHFSISCNNEILISYTYHTNSYDYSDVSFNLDELMKIFGIEGMLFDFEFEDEFSLDLNKSDIYFEIENKVREDFFQTIRNDSRDPIDSFFVNFSDEKFKVLGDHHVVHINRHSTVNEINESLIEQVFRYLKDKILVDLNSKFHTNCQLTESKVCLIFIKKLFLLVRNFDANILNYEFYELLVNRNVKNRNIDLTDETVLLNRLVKKYFKHVDPNDPFYFGDWVNSWLEKFEIGKSIEVNNFNGEVANVEIIGLNNEKRDLSACGTGVTQIVTLLLLRLLDPYLIERINNRVLETGELIKEREDYKWSFYLEEPESNLHPNWQSLLMELIVDINQKYGFRFIIETHSEYMIRKLQFLMADKTKNLDTESALIYYFNSKKNVDESQGEPKIKKIKIDKNGGLSDNFGPGFYDEAINLEFELLKLRNYQKN